MVLGLTVACGGRSAEWEPVAALQHARAAHAVVATEDAIVALAGIDGAGAPVLAVERFDGVGWRVETRLPGRGLNAPAAVALEGEVYLLGGFDTTSNMPVDRVDVYALATGRWRTGTPLPAPRGGHAAVVLAGQIHVIGGGNSQSTIADHDVYDPTTRVWSARAGLPRAAGSVAAVVYEGKVLAIGGRSGGEDFAAVDVYDPATDAWTAGPSIEAVIPGGRYAVLPFEGTTDTINAAWTALLRDWLPASGLQLDQRPCFEHYPPGARFDPATGVFDCEICVPVAPL